eukprot:SAG11_NODE_1617_length_4575_cov_7.041332_5_plen_30_part_00
MFSVAVPRMLHTADVPRVEAAAAAAAGYM